MDFETDVILGIVSLASVVTLTQFAGFSLKDIGTISVTALNRITDNIVPFLKLLMVLVVSRAMRFRLDTKLGLGDITYNLRNPLLYLKLLLTLILNFLAGATVYLLTGVAGSGAEF